MNRIYQGRVSKVQTLKPGTKGTSPENWEDSPDGQNALWQHHELFQDAVNYYIVALASLGVSAESKLTRLRGLLANVWEAADKKGQRRRGMRESLQRAWQLAEPPTLAETVERFQRPLLNDRVPLTTAEKAAEYLLFKLGGEAAIQKGGREFLPMFCDVESNPTFKLSAGRRGRSDDERRLQQELHRDLTPDEIRSLANSITLGSVVNLQPQVSPDSGDAVVEKLKVAAATFANTVSKELLEEWMQTLPPGFSLPKRRGGNINVKRVDACTLFLAFPNETTKALFQSTFAAPRPAAHRADEADSDDTEADGESQFLVDGDDPIKLARGTREFVFEGFTSLPLWSGDGRKLAWKEFDIAAFKEALKVYNQFQQNVEKREEKLTGFATKLLVMDGERAMEAYTGETDTKLRSLLQKVWMDCDGKPKPTTNDSGEAAVIPRFKNDARIDRLRQIVNDDLAEEYRLTDGRRTAYGLRRRTMKGWGEVKRRWQTIVRKGVAFSEAKKQELQAALDELRGGEKREQIGSHKLFGALLANEAAWSIWREPDDKLQDKILKNEWAADSLEAFREYCEIREAMEEVSARPLNFTPADARYSRRLFMFTDVCSFGSDRGVFKHDPKALAVTVPVAVRGADGRFAGQPCRLTYSAPRLLRDQIRSEEGGYAQDWVQPMMRAFFGEAEERANPQELKDAAVQLMPDIDAKGEHRVLLNFPLNLATTKCWERVYDARPTTKGLFAVRYSKKDKKEEKPLNGGIWESNIRTFWESDQPKKRDVLYWPSDERTVQGWSKGDWWEKLPSFRVLAADLGTRHAASIAILDCCKAGGGTARFIGSACGEDWFGRYLSGAILRLPGENMVILRPESSLDKDGKGKAFREELYGEQGRPADDDECVESVEMLDALLQPDLFGGITEPAALQKQFSFPELNDKLLVAMRRAQNWIATCISWQWKLSQPDSEEQRVAAVAQLKEQERMPDWRALADGSEENTTKLRDALHVHITVQRQRVQEQLLALTRRILPLRGRTWEWVEHPDKAACHLLRQTQEGTASDNVRLRGQRGISMARIEQLSELRRRWQSLNQSLRREIGQKPLTASEMRNDPIPDPCPDILTKLENIREQRVNQTAHLILAQALGLKLRSPQKTVASRALTDTHGEYEVARPPVDFIVMEDLARYLSDQGRAKSENTRLMKWCHRAVLLKVKMLAEPFGIPVLETPAAYSSRFCSLTGVAGFRAAEVGWRDRNEFRWRVLLDEAAKAKAEGKEVPPNIAIATELFAKLEEISRSEQPNRTLLAPQPGGPMFVTAKPAAHPIPAKNRKQAGNRDVLPMQADLNAAANLAFRAVAHPACAHIHHRLRSERKKGSKGQPETILTREPRRFGKDKVSIILRPGDSLPKERNTNFFFDKHHIADFGRARLETDDDFTFQFASGPGVWKSANDRIKQWHRCMRVNAARLRDWGIEPPSDWEDDVPM